ncbi:hypothetical protein SERLADRAFT_404668 [Serpula lacrymans var. lacrymans S7.9]|uniref:Uncharacterized protein n=1 Tax=Serpula lacrymans var. lacrymans (strain S7.9) TaxID=578457 RepID=F8NE13_SERL9|nr:uncharacterized protein SERLADRAFT_404668 [Serpula lacrymans var. lacrymans S7.9]EGO30541.1 hypothetical protein SERLADRAFT_404668 [Serpula lacrymans var. lacrymans S7.9]
MPEVLLMMPKLDYTIHIWKSYGVQILYNGDNGNKEPGNKVAEHGKYLGLTQVLNIVKKKEIEKRIRDLYRVKPGQSDYIGKLQSVLKVMLTELSEEELAKFKEKHKEWYTDRPSEEVIPNHEQNDKAVFELFSKVQPNWQNVKIWEAWDGSVPKESLPDKHKEKVKLPLNNNGYPILVDEDLSPPVTFSDLQATIRCFLTTYYQISTGNMKASGYIPPGYKFWELSYMTKEEV